MQHTTRDNTETTVEVVHIRIHWYGAPWSYICNTETITQTLRLQFLYPGSVSNPVSICVSEILTSKWSNYHSQIVIFSQILGFK